MSGSKVEGQEEEAAGGVDVSDQRREEAQPHARHLWRLGQLRGQDGPGGVAGKGEPCSERSEGNRKGQLADM